MPVTFNWFIRRTSIQRRRPVSDPCPAAPLGTTFVRVVWSNGLTAFPTGAEVGAAVVASYRAIYTLPSGSILTVPPLAVADLANEPVPSATTAWCEAHGSDDRRRTDRGPRRQPQRPSERPIAAAAGQAGRLFSMIEQAAVRWSAHQAAG